MKLKNFVLYTVATLGLTATTKAQNVPSYVSTNGLVGWWPFSGNASDESGNGNNGTIHGAILTADRFGNSNKALSFDGINDYVQIANNISLEPSSSITLSAWVLIDPTQTTSFPPIISKESGIPTGYTSYALIAGNAGLNQLGDIGLQITTNNGGYSWTGFNGTSYLNQWVFVTGVYNGSSMKIYHNGSLTSTTPKTGNVQYQNFPLTFARSMANSTSNFSYFKGLIDDIGIWNRALNQQEITDLYNGHICFMNITVTDTLLINMGITSFNPLTYKNTIKIYPNPTNDHITINYGAFALLNGYQLKIENSLGQQVFQTNINQQLNYLNLSNWGGNGLFFVRIVDPQGNTVDLRKIVLQ
jgi:hypothetical protein